MSSTTSPEPPGKPSNVFETALQAWTEIDLQNLQRKLDKQGLELKTEQKLSLASRKELATRTKGFKKLDDEAKLADMKPLLKMYQNEIDLLTTKQKKVETFFFEFYRVVAEAPDPKPLLELSLDAVLELNEAAALKQETARLNEELAKKADYDVLKQRLLRNEQKAAELLSSRLKAKEDEWRAIVDEKESNWSTLQKQHDSQIAAYKATIEELRTSNEVTELQLSSQNKQLGHSTASASVLAELDMVTRDADLWKKRVYELEKRNEQLRRDLSISQNDTEKESAAEEHARKLAEYEGENALLVASLNQKRAELETVTQKKDAKAQLLAREVQQATLEISRLKLKLEKTADYDELMHEVQLLRHIEFGEGDIDADERLQKDIDSLLIARNKAMTRELAEHRSRNEETTGSIQSLQAELASVTQELTRVQKLNSKLENDLANVNDIPFNDTASMRSGISRATRKTSGSAVDETSILPIITKQRDRFRDKNKELEDDLRKLYNSVNELKRQIKSLKTDNEELYEKTRYIALLKSQEKASSMNSRKLLTPRANVSDLENPYQTTYESKLHPIEQFRQREQERINSRLSPVERLFIFVTRSILATRMTRMLFLAYCLFLHFVVMFTTVHLVHLNTRMIPEVGLNHSTGGVPDAGKVYESAP